MSVTKDEANKLLLDAAEAGDDAKVLAALDAGAEIDAVDNNGHTALMEAARFDHTETCRLLLEKKADIFAADNAGITALMQAADSGHTETCRLLLEKGADINAMDNDGDTVLMWAAVNGWTETCQLLLDNGADINAVSKDSYTALLLVARYYHPETAQYLLRQGAAVPGLFPDGDQALANRAINNYVKRISSHLAAMKASGQAAFPAGQKLLREECLTPEGKPTDALLDVCATGQFAALIAAPLLRAQDKEGWALFKEIYHALPLCWQEREAATYLGQLARMEPPRRDAGMHR